MDFGQMCNVLTEMLLFCLLQNKVTAMAEFFLPLSLLHCS